MTKIDSRDYEAGEKLTTHKAIVRHLLDGGMVTANNGMDVYGHNEGGFFWVGKDITRSSTGNFPMSVTWCRAILKRKPISWEDAVRAMLDGKRVWDADGDERKIIDREFRYHDPALSMWLNLCPDHSQEPFYLTQPPTVVNVSTATNGVVDVPKSRRRVSREDAICAMVRDREQHAWDDGGLEYRMQKGCHLQANHTVGGWGHTSMSHYNLYLDPPEAK